MVPIEGGSGDKKTIFLRLGQFSNGVPLTRPKLSEKVISDKFVQFKNAFFPIVATLEGNTMVERLLQLAKAPSLISSSLHERDMLILLMALPLNTSAPIDSKLSGNFISFSFAVLPKASLLMNVKPLGKFISVIRLS